MIEIIILVLVWRNIGATVRENGRDAVPYQLAAVGLWLGFELVGGLIGWMIGFWGTPLYLWSFVCAMFSLAVSYKLADRSVAPQPPLPDEGLAKETNVTPIHNNNSRERS